MDRLEKIRVIPSAERWNEIRRIRNQMRPTEYPDSTEQNAKT